MDKVIIFGTFEFVGFHFCNRLLEKGCQVKGVHFQMIANDYLEEKRLEIGRNANFEELTILQIEKFTNWEDEPALIIFSLYDLFMGNHECILEDKTVAEPVMQFLKSRNKRKDIVVYLLPIQYLLDSQRTSGIAVLKNFLTQTKELAQKVQHYYLPTIFGPWQPSFFLFQRILSGWNGLPEESITEKEWTLDAIFIDDATDSMIEIMETGKENHFLLESGHSDSWRQCAELLKIVQNDKKATENLCMRNIEQVARLPVKKLTPYREALEIQREHFSQILRFK